MDPSAAASEFREAMISRVYAGTGRECGYWAHRFLQMVKRRGGVGAAKALLARRQPGRALDTLREKHRLDLAMETLVLDDRFAALFTEAERAEARRRLLGPPPLEAAGGG